MADSVSSRLRSSVHKTPAKEQNECNYEFLFTSKPISGKQSEKPLSPGIYMYLSLPADCAWMWGLKPKDYFFNYVETHPDTQACDFHADSLRLMRQVLETGEIITTSDTTHICKPGKGRVLVRQSKP
jgi:hypothetical protein